MNVRVDLRGTQKGNTAVTRCARGIATGSWTTQSCSQLKLLHPNHDAHALARSLRCVAKQPEVMVVDPEKVVLHSGVQMPIYYAGGVRE